MEKEERRGEKRRGEERRGELALYGDKAGGLVGTERILGATLVGAGVAGRARRYVERAHAGAVLDGVVGVLLVYRLVVLEPLHVGHRPARQAAQELDADARLDETRSQAKRERRLLVRLAPQLAALDLLGHSLLAAHTRCLLVRRLGQCCNAMQCQY